MPELFGSIRPSLIQMQRKMSHGLRNSVQKRALCSCRNVSYILAGVLEAPSWGVKDVAKWRCVPEGTLAYLASRLPLIVLIRRAEPVVFFCEVFLAEHIDGFGWISRRLGGAGWGG